MVGCYNSLYVSCFGDFEKFVCISLYCVYALSLHIESTDSMMLHLVECVTVTLIHWHFINDGWLPIAFVTSR